MSSPKASLLRIGRQGESVAIDLKTSCSRHVVQVESEGSYSGIGANCLLPKRTIDHPVLDGDVEAPCGVFFPSLPLRRSQVGARC